MLTALWKLISCLNMFIILPYAGTKPFCKEIIDWDMGYLNFVEANRLI